MLLSLPLVYLVRSSIVSLLYIIGITYYCCNTNYFSYPKEQTYFYWFLILGIVPHYYKLLTTKAQSNFTLFHNWLIAISLIICLGSFTDTNEKYMYMSYMSLFAIYYFAGKNSYFEKLKLKFNSYLIIGKLGMLFILFIYTFKWFWNYFNEQKFALSILVTFPEIIVGILLTIVAIVLFYKKNSPTNFKQLNILEIVFIAFIPFHFIGYNSSILANIALLMIGISEIKRGNQLNDLKILNFGLLIITILIICRFFDTDFSFVIRGILFISIGLGFFLTNYLMLKKRNQNEK